MSNGKLLGTELQTTQRIQCTSLCLLCNLYKITCSWQALLRYYGIILIKKKKISFDCNQMSLSSASPKDATSSFLLGFYERITKRGLLS